MELALYRITQEILNNIFKYAKAKQTDIILSSNGKSISLEIIDDGEGFDPSTIELSKPESHGLNNIKGRIQQINAIIDYQLTEPGTKVIISLDL